MSDISVQFPYNIYLTGFMGAGKTAAAQYFKTAYQIRTAETDSEIAAHEKKSIPDIFYTSGEAYFRKIESSVLKEFAKEQNIIVSCGGGIILNPENVAVMKNSGKVVLLNVSPQTAYERIKDDKERPLLNGNMNEAYIRRLMDKRRKLYEEAADIIVDTDGKKIKDICEEIILRLKRRE